METIFLSVSAGSGPEECAHAAALTVKVILREIQNKPQSEITANVIESETAHEKGNIRSALIVLEGKEAKRFADSWTGIIQWIWQSTYRPHHKRKNWFVQVRPYHEPSKGTIFSSGDVRFETARASGPGGQYVNKTESAVRAVHVPSGKAAIARGERSQLLNKRLALTRLASMFTKEQSNKKKKSRSDLRHSHWELERGNPIRVYDGETMKLLRENKNV